MSKPGKGKYKLLFRRTYKYLFDFIVVFSSVFLAFWLSELKDRRNEEKKKREIYIAIYEDLNSFYESGKRENEKGFLVFFNNLDHQVDSLVASKNLPVTNALYGDYWKIDIIHSLIQGGYLKDVDIETFKKVTRFNTVHQNFLENIKYYNEFYDKYITANYDQEIDYFYKPGTNELKKKYTYLNVALENIEGFAELLVGLSRELSAEIKQKHIDNPDN